MQPAQKQNRRLFRYMIGDLMLPGSGIIGYENLKNLYALAQNGRSCLILSAHFSNFDVPALYTLLYRRGEEARRIFESIQFIAGRKLTEGGREVKAMAEMFNRVVISAKAQNMPPEEMQLALAINKASQKAIGQMQNQGYIFLLYPTGTRSRLGEPQTHSGIREIYNYMRKFEFFLCCGISGLILPARDDVPMAQEYPRKDKVEYAFGEVRETGPYISALEAQIHDEATDRKQYVVDQVMEEIYSLGMDPRRIGTMASLKYSPYAIAATNTYRNVKQGTEQRWTQWKTITAEKISANITEPLGEKTRSFREALKNLFD